MGEDESSTFPARPGSTVCAGRNRVITGSGVRGSGCGDRGDRRVETAPGTYPPPILVYFSRVMEWLSRSERQTHRVPASWLLHETKCWSYFPR
jgi:hypothetical protein